MCEDFTWPPTWQTLSDLLSSLIIAVTLSTNSRKSLFVYLSLCTWWQQEAWTEGELLREVNWIQVNRMHAPAESRQTRQKNKVGRFQVNKRAFPLLKVTFSVSFVVLLELQDGRANFTFQPFSRSKYGKRGPLLRRRNLRLNNGLIDSRQWPFYPARAFRDLLSAFANDKTCSRGFRADCREFSERNLERRQIVLREFCAFAGRIGGGGGWRIYFIYLFFYLFNQFVIVDWWLHNGTIVPYKVLHHPNPLFYKTKEKNPTHSKPK